MPKHPLMPFISLALSAMIAWPAPAAAPFGRTAHGASLAMSPDLVIRVAQFQELDAETGSAASESEAADDAQDSIAVLEVDTEAFTWRAQKDGQRIVFTGIVPSEATQSLIAVTTSGEIVDNTDVGTGAPDGFVVDALTGLDALAELVRGTLHYADEAWSLQGHLVQGDDTKTLETILGRATTPRDAWTVDIVAAQPADTAGVPSTEVAAEDAAASTRDSADTQVTDASDEDGAVAQVAPVAAADDGELVDSVSTEAARPADAGEMNLSQQESADEGVAAAVGGPDGDSPDPDYRFSALKGPDGALTVLGDVPDTSTQALVEWLAGEPGQDSLEVNPRAPQDFVSVLYAGLAALDHLDQGQVAFANGNWLLTGRAGIDTQKNEALAALERLGGAEQVRTMITAPPASLVCQTEVTAFMADKSILFTSGSANLTPESRAILPGIAELLSICPQTTVYVEGHTDSDGGENLNLPLSVARAEAVVDELIALGVSAQRLYAVGYGSSLPIASNDTVAGKRQNRRIAFTFED